MRLIFLALTLCAANLKAADKIVPRPSVVATNEVKPKFRPFNGIIKAFDRAAHTVTLEGGKAQTFVILSETRINKDGKPATIGALVPKETVGGRARQAANGRWEALTLNVGKKPAKPSAPQAKPVDLKNGINGKAALTSPALRN